jgi:hypothetical protein
MKFHSTKQAVFPPDLGSKLNPAQATRILRIGMVLLALLSAAAVFAAPNAEALAEKNKREHGQKFENANGSLDDTLRNRRDSTARARAKTHPRNGHATYTNGKMSGHWKHEDRPSRTEGNAKKWQDKRMWRQGGTWQGAKNWEGVRASDWEAQHATWPERGGYGGAFVSQADYDRHFSTAHDFRLKSKPDMKRGYPHFTRDGAHFVMVDPYPQSWNEKWYETDDVYIQYDQGYYLHNRKDPGPAIAVMVLQ